MRDKEDYLLLEEIKRDLKELRKKEDSKYRFVWEMAMKASVPMVILALGWVAMVDRASHNHELRLTAAEERIDNLPPSDLKEDIRELKSQNLQVLQRVAALEALIRKTND